jgi:hypothetical protein
MNTMRSPKQLTFLFQDTVTNTMNTLEWETRDRTIEDAWDNVVIFLCRRHNVVHELLQVSRFAKIMTFEGLCKVLDESKPLRRATPQEVRELERNNG